MKNKAFYLVLVLVLIFVAGFLVWKPKGQNTQESSKTSVDQTSKESSVDNSQNPPATSTQDTTPSKATSTKDNPDQSQATYSGESDINSPDVAVFEVDYDGTSFSPKSTTINKNDIVVFKNLSTKDFWPASNNHPTHTLYPEFDPKKAIAAGGKFEFKFAKVGTWGFHDHKNPTAVGTIIVK